MTRVPLGLLAGLAVMAGVAVGWPGVALAVLASAGILLLDMPTSADWRPVVVTGALVAGLATVGALRGHPDLSPADPRVANAASVVGVVQSMPASGGRFETALFKITELTMDDGTVAVVSIPVIASVPVSLRMNVGDRLELGGEFTPLPGLEPGFRNYVASRQATGVYRGYGVRLLKAGDSPLRPLVTLRRDLTDRLRRVLPGDLGALAAGIVTGDDSALGDETANAFQVSGLSHITAVSGQNIAILAGLVTLLFRGQAVRRPIAIQIATLLLVWLYVGLTGFGAPAIRAGLFVTCALAASRFGRKPDFLTILALVSGGMLLVNPAYRASVSFWLSMAASAALVTAIDLPSGGIRRWVVRTVGALAAAQLATVPIAIAVFGTWSLGSVPANLIVGPVMELAFPVCFLLAACLYLLPIAAPVIALIAEGPLAVSIGTARGVAFLFPQTDLAAGGFLVVFAAALPCLALICLLSEDMRRWGRRLERAFANDRARIGATGAGVVVGTTVAIIALTVLLH